MNDRRPKSSGVSGEALHKVLIDSREPGEQLFGIVDAARDRGLAFRSWAEHEQESWSLFGPEISSRMRRVAPFLVTFHIHSTYPYPNCDFLHEWADHLWNSSGILFFSEANPRQLWNHLTQVFQVRDTNKNRYYFRFYDPRVFRVFLPTCSKSQIHELFGPVRQFIVEAEQPGELLVCRPSSEGVNIERRMVRHDS